MSESDARPVAVIEDDEFADQLPDDVDFGAVLADVEQTINGLADLELTIDSPEDLEQVRQQLPTEPTRAEIVAAALPLPLRRELEYVHPSERQSGYWRRSRERRDPEALSDAELRQRKAFIETQIDNRGDDGTVWLNDGRQIPRSAVETARQLRGMEFTVSDGMTDAEAERGRSLFDRITSWL